MAIDKVRQRDAFERIARWQHKRFGQGAPVRDTFFINALSHGVQHPLASLMNSRSGSGGGRGGKTRVLLYLSLLWVVGGRDHTTTRPAWFWADLLGLSDPRGAGSRVIRSSWDELERRRFVAIERASVSGDLPTIRPLKEDRSGEPYTIPKGHGGDTYRRIPEAAWKTLFHNASLTGPGLSMYLVALRTFEQTPSRVLTFPRSYFRTEYGMSESTRKTGLRNLVDIGVLDEEPGRSVEDGASGRRRRGRTQYTLLSVYQPPASASATGPDSPSRQGHSG